MATLNIPQNYEDGEVFEKAALDDIADELETFFNTTKINDDNIQTAGITASTKFADSSVTSAKFAAEAVTENKLIADSVTTAKIADSSVTNAKFADEAITQAKFANTVGRGTVGSIMLFHSYNAEVSVPRGWMLCDGDVINEANYEATHGAGTYTTDAISASAIAGKYLPNFTSKYAVGATSTTQTGAGAITSVGNSGSTANLAHTHTVASHTHTTPAGTIPNDTLSTPVRIRASTATGSSSPATGSGLSASTSIAPESIQFMFIMKVV